MSLEQSAAPAATPSAVQSEAPAPNPNHVPENRSGQTDPFTQAFNKAQDDLGAREREAEAKAAEVDESEESTEQEPEAPQTPPTKVTLEPPAYWSRERKEAFKYQPRHVQEAWLAEDPQPNSRWSAEIKEAFGKLPREAKELYLTQVADIERGANAKLQANAADRKFAEEVRAVVPQHLREYMTQKQLSEPQVFAHLLNLQQQSMQDPAGYVRNFVQNNKLNPSEIFGVEIPQPGAPLPVEAIRSHPEYQQIQQQFNALRAEIERERAQRAEQEQARLNAEFEQIVTETDGDGNPLYPYIRLLADPMARLFETDSELFSSMSTKEKFATAYRMALEQFPELSTIKRTAEPKPADVPTKDAHTAAAEKRQEILERAITPKPRVPTPPPPKANGKTGDPFEDAYNAASRKLGLAR